MQSARPAIGSPHAQARLKRQGPARPRHGHAPTWLRLESHGRLYNQRAALLAASPTMTTTSDAMTSGGGSSRMPPRLHSRSNFTTRAAQDDSHQLQRRWSLSQLSAQDESEPLLAAGARRGRPVSASRENSPFGSVSALFARGRAFVTSAPASRAASVAPPSGQRRRRRRSSGIDAPAKLGTFAGVFVPTTLNVLSILMFLRFGFILGQSGVLGMMGELPSLGTSSSSSRARRRTCSCTGGFSFFLCSTPRRLDVKAASCPSPIRTVALARPDGTSTITLPLTAPDSYGVLPAWLQNSAPWQNPLTFYSQECSSRAMPSIF